MGETATSSSLAVLDPSGVVVSWYGREGSSDPRGDGVVGHHLSQFYLSGDLASDQPLLDLAAVRAGGTSTRSGWRCEPGYDAFWATAVIESVLRRNGELRGFSCVTSAADEAGAVRPSAAPLEPTGQSPARRVVALRRRIAALNLTIPSHRQLHHLWRRLRGVGPL